jgi:hypothetical protein
VESIETLQLPARKEIAMDYKLDVRETLRHWTVKDLGTPLNPRLELEPGDELVFHGDGAPTGSTITRRRKMTAEIPWGDQVEFKPSTTDLTAGQATGNHISGKAFTIDFFPRGHSGKIDFGKNFFDAGTWMADEGP